MQFIQYYRCSECHRTFSAEKPMNLCPADNRPVEMILDTSAINDRYPGMGWYRPEEKTMWRFGPLLPFDIKYQKDKICSLGEGSTPVFNISAYCELQGLKLHVFLKDEGQKHIGYGANPTRSFKDRGMSVVTTMARHYGLKKLSVPTQGNAGDSLCEYGFHHGMEVAVIMPDDTPMPILGKVAAYSHRYPNIHLNLVKGTIREAGQFMKDHYLNRGFFNCATFQEPGWRIEGKKTMGLELAEPWHQYKNEWRLPEAILYPTGGGTGILGMWKAFEELEALGVIDSRRPKIIAVQSEANCPVVNAVNDNLQDTVATDGGQTLATGLNVPGGVGHKAVLRIIRESGGNAISVSEKEIEHHCRAIFQHHHLWISPEGAATIAALEQAKDQQLISQEDLVVCFNTGSAEKYFPEVQHLFSSKDTVSS